MRGARSGEDGAREEVKERGNGNKTSGMSAIDDREGGRVNRARERVNSGGSGGGSMQSSAERC